MNTVDQNAQVAVEVIATGVRISTQMINGILDLFLEKKDKHNLYQDDTTVQGKQNLKNLFEKYQNGGIETLDENITKTEIDSYKKEFKKMGVDFSIKKNGKDDYSLFFAGKDRESIEKGMSNAIGKYTKRREKINNIKNIMFDFNIDNHNKELTDSVDEKLNMMLDENQEISQEEIVKDFDLFSQEPTQKQLDLAEKLGVEDYKNMNKVEISLALEKSGADKSFFTNLDKSMDKEKIQSNKNKFSNSKTNSLKPTFNVNDLQKKSVEMKKSEDKEKIRSNPTHTR